MNLTDPRISVIVNSYNSGRYIAEALDSVLAQTLKPFELFVMDDASTDDTQAVVRRYGSTIQWLAVAHGGVGAARNASLAHVHGDLVAFLDADDLWTPTKLAVQAAAFRASPTPDAVFGHVQQMLSPDMDPEQAARVWAPDYPVPGRIATTMLITPAALARVGGFTTTLRITEFLDWYARALEAGLHMPMLPDLVARRRVHGQNQSLNNAVDRLEYPQVIKAALDRRRRAKLTPH